MKSDRQKHMLGTNTAVIAFDLMKTIPTPVVSTGITYYKRQLWTYCLGKLTIEKRIFNKYLILNFS